MQLPDGYAPLFVEGEPDPVGAVGPAIAAALKGLARERGDGLGLPAGGLQDALDEAVTRLAAAGLCPPRREEAIAVRAGRDARALARVDRSAAAPLGLLVRKVCLNGIVPGEPMRIWLARRSRDQRTAPGLLDTTVAGGVPAGATDDGTLRAEAWEEASLTPERLAVARPVARLDRVAPRPDGLAREDLLVWDLTMRPDERPHPRDDEIDGFALWTLPDLEDALVAPGGCKPGAAIVLRDGVRRWRAVKG
ncbi:NUDIX domain-containing protein [Salinarimonas sp.]|uniref:NUDIX hydrolase n=1 Tax=Salinarimonas sp. TaxID=2766526 RepID=UPI0032D8C174